MAAKPVGEPPKKQESPGKLPEQKKEKEPTHVAHDDKEPISKAVKPAAKKDESGSDSESESSSVVRKKYPAKPFHLTAESRELQEKIVKVCPLRQHH